MNSGATFRLSKLFLVTAMALSTFARADAGPATATNTQPSWLCVGNFQTEQAGRDQLARFVTNYSDRAGWEKRAANIRTCVLRGAGLSTLPKKQSSTP